MPEASELEEIGSRMDGLATRWRGSPQGESVRALLKACSDIGKSWSGSWLGYHANVYYAGLKPPPPGAHFSQEWGLDGGMFDGTTGDWQEFDPAAVRETILSAAGDPDLDDLARLRDNLTEEIEAARIDVLSILGPWKTDPMVERVQAKVEEITVGNAAAILDAMKPQGQFMSRDPIVFGQGVRIPPHLAIH